MPNSLFVDLSVLLLSFGERDDSQKDIVIIYSIILSFLILFNYIRAKFWEERVVNNSHLTSQNNLLNKSEESRKQ
jgi:hypothetical protein